MRNAYLPQRALRRHHRWRKKEWVRRELGSRLEYVGISAQGRFVGRWATTPAPCSCGMCGNPRHHGGGPTRQELLAAVELEACE